MPNPLHGSISYLHALSKSKLNSRIIVDVDLKYHLDTVHNNFIRWQKNYDKMSRENLALRLEIIELKEKLNK